jgi:hypothetical protein
MAVGGETADPRPDNPCTSESGEATDHVDGGAAAKVNEAGVEEPVQRARGRRPALVAESPCSHK